MWGLNMEEQKKKELERTPKFDITMIENFYNQYLPRFSKKIMLLMDEVSSFHPSFFKEDEGDSLYEVLMNQLRTTRLFNHKVAVYPQTPSDCLQETRYGQTVNLIFDVFDEDAIPTNRKFIINVLETYLNEVKVADKPISLKEYFDVSNVFPYVESSKGVENENVGDSIEQLMFGSYGYMRRLMLITEKSMIYAAKRIKQSKKNYPFVEKVDVLNALRDLGRQLYEKFSPDEQRYLKEMAKLCIKNTRFKFSFPGSSTFMKKFTERGEEDNIVLIREGGRGRTALVYEFHYAFCIYQQIPTHLLFHIEKEARSRSVTNGNWIGKSVRIIWKSDARVCKSCGAPAYDPKANFCKSCGYPLPPK